MGKRLTYPEGKGREFMLRVTGGEDAYYSAYSSPNRWHFNPQGPFKWRVNSAGWVYVAKPAVLKVLGEKRFGWREYRVEKDGMIKQVGFKDFTTKEEAEKAFLSLNSQFNGDQDYATVVKYNPSNDTYDVRLEGGEQNTGKVLNMAKFKEGDRVVEIPSRFGSMGTGTVEWCEDDPKEPQRVRVRFDRGGTWVMDIRDIRAANAARSTNSIVAKAINAVVRNGYVKLYAKAGGTTTVYEGDKVEYDGKVYTAKALGSPSMDSATLVDDAGNKLVVKMKDYKLKALNEDTSVVIEKAVNAKFKVGDKVKGTMGASPMGVVTKIEKSDSWIGNICTVKWEDGTTTHPGEGQLMLANAAHVLNSKWVILYRDGGKEKIEAPSHAEARKIAEAKSKKSGRGYTSVIVDDGVDYDRWQFFNAKACNSTNAIVRKAMNATALNFSPGDKVSIVDTDIRYGGDKGEVVRKDGFRYVVRLTSRSDKPEVYFQPNQLKAANSEDAQGHEHGSDGKFASKGGGSSDDGYEDPKTKRMKERLAKMREKNEALRKEIEARKAGLAQKKADTEKMRAEVMKANVDKWKAAQKSKNAVVQKALNWGGGRRPSGDQSHTYSEGDVMAYFKRLKKVMPDESDSFLKSEATRLASQGQEGKDEMEYIESEARRKASEKVALGKKLLNIVSACQGIMRQISSHLSKAKAVYSDIERNRPAGLPALGGGFKEGLQEVETYLKSLESLITPRNPSLTPFLNARAKVDPNQLDKYRKMAKEFSDKVGILWQATQAIERQLDQAGTYTDYKWPTGQIMSVWGDLNDAAEGLWRSSGELALTSAELKRLERESRWD